METGLNLNTIAYMWLNTRSNQIHYTDFYILHRQYIYNDVKIRLQYYLQRPGWILTRGKQALSVIGAKSCLTVLNRYSCSELQYFLTRSLEVSLKERPGQQLRRGTENQQTNTKQISSKK